VFVYVETIATFFPHNLLNISVFVPAGIISLLEEPMPELKVFALKKLDLIVDEFWPEISEAIEKM
jgi:26S proteasome regulatory subunit N2